MPTRRAPTRSGGVAPRFSAFRHTAILFETQAALAATVYSAATKHPNTFTGSADHVVSEAFYFVDPEGYGIELYRSPGYWGRGGGARAPFGGRCCQSVRFYVHKLGFETTAEMGGSALFVSAGGGHHHMAMNTWNSRGAGQRQQELGAGQVDIFVADADALGSLQQRMRHFGVPLRDDGKTLHFDDPWANLIVVRTA